MEIVQDLDDLHFMTRVSVDEAQMRLSELLGRVARGEEIIITVSGTPRAKLVPFAAPRQRLLGQDAGAFEVPADFDSPLSGSVWEEPGT